MYCSIIHSIICIVLLQTFCISTSVLSAFATDATSFNPVNVSITATSSSVPVGTIIAWPSATNPSDMDKWLECNGQSVPTSYSDLRAIVGSTVPDYTGMFLRGTGGNAGALGVQQEQAVYIPENTTELTINGAVKVFCGSSSTTTNQDYLAPSYQVLSFATYDPNEYPTKITYHDSSTTVGIDSSFQNTDGATETRPVNTAVRYLIRALP